MHDHHELANRTECWRRKGKKDHIICLCEGDRIASAYNEPATRGYEDKDTLMPSSGRPATQLRGKRRHKEPHRTSGSVPKPSSSTGNRRLYSAGDVAAFEAIFPARVCS